MPSRKLGRGTKLAIAAGVILGGAALLYSARQAYGQILLQDGGVIVNAVNSGQSISVPQGMYILPANFSGFKLTRFTQQVTADQSTFFFYPPGYSGPCIEINDLTASGSFIKWTGGQFIEYTPPGSIYYQTITRRATGLRFYSHSSNGVFGNVVRDVVFNDPLVGITTDIDSPTGFVNNNKCDNVTVWHPQTYGIRTSQGAALNSFTDCLLELGAGYAGPNVIGVYIDGFRNKYDHISPEDAAGLMRTGVVAATAIAPRIIGGEIDYYNYVDNSPPGNVKFL